MANWKTKDSAPNDSLYSRTVSSAYRKYLSQNKITKAFSKSSLKPAVNEILMQNLLNIWTSLEQLLKLI